MKQVNVLIRRMLKSKKGTALLVSLLVMGVLISVSLALSTLILRESRVTRELLDSGAAYYAAESGIEVALYNLDHNLPGWEPDSGNFVALKLDDEYGAVSEYRVSNTCSAYPCFDEGFDVSSIGVGQEKVFYDSLDLNESITIPLFVVGDGDVEVPVGGFTVEFFSVFNTALHFSDDMQAQLNNINSWDVLRWKIFGIHNETKVTETISDFTALSDLGFEGMDETFSANAKRPSWFGTTICDQMEDRYYSEIICGMYGGEMEVIKEPGQESLIYAGTCPNTHAREYYHYGGDGEIESEDIQACYPINEFLMEHKLNYLSLTNLMNPSVFSDDLTQAQREALSRLYFRVELAVDEGRANTDNQTVREYADITSNGYSGDSKQTINVKIKRGSFMPVFNFSLYSTYETDEHAADNYWYGEEG